jgi:CRISPR type III-B/RAMP module-associated protein Cmr5
MSRDIDPIKAALEEFEATIKKLVDSYGGGNAERKNQLGAKIRTRTRDALDMLENFGLVPTISFFLANAKKDGDVATSYNIYLTAILRYIKRLVPDLGIDEGKEAKDISEPHTVLEKIYSVSWVITPLLKRYLLMLKRLCEATWKPERGG